MTDHRSLITLLSGLLLAAASVWAGDGPGGVSGCVCWLSAKDLPRGPLAAWPDLSKSGNDFKQDDPAKQPQVVENEKTKVKAVRFDGKQLLSLGKNRFAEKVGLNAVPEEQFHVYLLATIFPGHEGFLLVRGGTAAAQRTFWVVSVDGEFRIGIRGTANLVPRFGFGQPALVAIRWNGKDLSASINGKSVKVAPGGAEIEAEPVVLLGDLPGTTRPVPLIGLVFEVVVFDRALSPEESAKVKIAIKAAHAPLAVPGR